jgi:serine/threonine protein kinase
MFESPNSTKTKSGINTETGDIRETIHSGNHSTTDGCDENGEYSSPNAVNQLECAIQAGQIAAERLENIEAHSKLTQFETAGGESDSEVTRLHWEDILVEELLGVGGFCCVCRIACKKLYRVLNPSKSRRSSFDDGDVVGSASFDDNCDDEASIPTSEEESWDDGSDDSGGCSSAHPEPERYYALKCLSNKTMMSPPMFLKGAADLVGEAFYLRRLKHPNIIRIYAVSAGSILDAFLKPGGYFLVVEVFHSILSDEMKHWRRLSSGDIPCHDNAINDVDDSIPSLATRLKFSLDVVGAMAYLHSKHVVFRDLKTQNCGIDEHGNAKLFDFGLAREVNEEGKVPGIAGTLRSMAPETILWRFCCKASDVYAFGLLLWELCSLTLPFENLSSPSEFKDLIAIGGARPSLDILDRSIAGVVGNCWNGDLLKRPTFEQVLGDLGKIIDKIERCGAHSTSENVLLL